MAPLVGLTYRKRRRTRTGQLVRIELGDDRLRHPHDLTLALLAVTAPLDPDQKLLVEDCDQALEHREGWICSSTDDARRGGVGARDRPSDATLDGVALERVAEATTRRFRRADTTALERTRVCCQRRAPTDPDARIRPCGSPGTVGHRAQGLSLPDIESAALRAPTARFVRRAAATESSSASASIRPLATALQAPGDRLWRITGLAACWGAGPAFPRPRVSRAALR